MHRRALLVAIGAALSGSAWGQAPKVPRIGYLLLLSLSENPSAERQAFLDGLREFGLVPGRTVEIDYASAQGEPDFLDDVARDLVARKPDVIVVSGAVSLVAAMRATRTIPIVFLAIGDPVGVGALRSLARPEGNVTGVSFISSDLAGKRVQLLVELLPAARRIALLWDKRNGNARKEAEATRNAIRRMGRTEVPFELDAENDVEGTLEQIRVRRPDAIYVVFEGITVAGRRSTIAEYGLRQRLPIVSGWSSLTEAGALLSYAPDIPAIFRRSAYYVHRILSGAMPRDLPVEQASTVEMVINLKTANALGISIPASMQLRANRLIQ